MKAVVTVIAVCALAGCMTASVACAAESAQVCAKYQLANYGYSHGYDVGATVMSGFELNQATRTYNYTTYSTYVVIFWGPGQATLIKLDLSGLGMGSIPVGGTDQEGKRWEVTRMSNFTTCL